MFRAVYTILQNKGNPFLPESGPRLKSYGHRGDVMDCDQAKLLCDAHNLGKMRQGTYTEERFVRCEKPITDIIQKARLPMFSNYLELTNKKTKQSESNNTWLQTHSSNAIVSHWSTRARNDRFLQTWIQKVASDFSWWSGKDENRE